MEAWIQRMSERLLACLAFRGRWRRLRSKTPGVDRDFALVWAPLQGCPPRSAALWRLDCLTGRANTNRRSVGGVAFFGSVVAAIAGARALANAAAEVARGLWVGRRNCRDGVAHQLSACDQQRQSEPKTGPKDHGLL